MAVNPTNAIDQLNSFATAPQNTGPTDFAGQLQGLKDTFALVQARSLETRKLSMEEGTKLSVAKKDANPA